MHNFKYGKNLFCLANLIYEKLSIIIRLPCHNEGRSQDWRLCSDPDSATTQWHDVDFFVYKMEIPAKYLL